MRCERAKGSARRRKSPRAAVVNDKGCEDAVLCVLCEYNLFLCLVSLLNFEICFFIRSGIKDGVLVCLFVCVSVCMIKDDEHEEKVKKRLCFSRVHICEGCRGNREESALSGMRVVKE